MNPWPLHNLDPLAFPVGPCAWRASMLAGRHARFVREHPSLVVIDPDDDDDTLRAIAPHLHGLPVMLAVREPEFSRRLPDLILSRLKLLGLERVEVVTLCAEHVLDLKGGGALQALFKLHDQRVAGDIGLAHHDARDAEWLALHTCARLLVTPYTLDDQAARHRALDTAKQYGMACLAVGPPADGARLTPAAADGDALRFSLAQSHLALPLLDRPIPATVQPMSPAEVERHWQAYTARHGAPAPLPRSSPPEAAG